MSSETPQNPRELGYYLALAQVGLEMVAPIGIGVYVDYLLDTTPWALITGTILGFVGGLLHLISLANKQEAGWKGRVDRPGGEDKRDKQTPKDRH